MSQLQRPERYSRQKDIVPAERIGACRATVIGVGAIGRQVALQLTAMGIPALQLIDPDTVDLSNLASQGYWERDLGRSKVQATAEACRWINDAVDIQEVVGRFRRSKNIGNVVFCAVDSVSVRRLIWQSLQNSIDCFIDGRMTAEAVRILSVWDCQSRLYYPTTLFHRQEAFAGSCTAKTTIYSANVAAGLMLAQFTKYLRQLPIDCDIQLNLLSSELSVTGLDAAV